MKLKILAIHNYYQIRSGEDLVFDDTVRILKKYGHSVESLTRDNSEFAGSKLKLLIVPFVTVFSIRTFFSVLCAVRKTKPDVAVVQNVFPLVSPSAYLALKISGVPVVQRVLNFRIICPSGVIYTHGKICTRCEGGANWNAVFYSCYRNSRWATIPLAFSLFVWRSFGLWRWGAAQFTTSVPFVGQKINIAVQDTNKIHTVFTPPLQTALPSSEQVKPREKSVLFVGRFVQEKGIFAFVRTAAALPNIPFEIIGAGDAESAAKKLGEDLGAKNILWRGKVYGEGLSEALYRCGVFVLPSEWHDNMPLILSQAMLHAIPVVASNLAGISDLIIEGVTGRLAVPADIQSFKEKILDVFDQPLQTRAMVDESLKRAHQWNEENFEKLFVDILKKTMPSA